MIVAATGQARIEARRRWSARQRGESVPLRVKAWTEEEERLLMATYAGHVGQKTGWLKRLSLSMGRLPSNVARKAKALGVALDPKRKRSSTPVQRSLWEVLDPRRKRSVEAMGRWSRPGRHHPRGMLGKNHTPEARSRMSMARLGVPRGPFSEETCMRMSIAMINRLRKSPESINPGKRGLGGRRVDLGGRYFRSSYEANYARYLNWAKIPWEYETKTFVFEAIKRGTRSYTPDFFLPEKNVYHEVKGWMDPKSKTKLDRMARYFPDVKVIVIGADWFKAAERQGLCSMIPGWECRHTRARAVALSAATDGTSIPIHAASAEIVAGRYSGKTKESE